MNKNDRRAIGLFLSGIGIVSAAYLFQNGIKRFDKELGESMERQSVIYGAIVDYMLERRLYQECARMEEEEIKKESLEIKNYITEYLENNEGGKVEMLPDTMPYNDRC